MRIENVSLPYPVLGISDDISPTLEDTNCGNPEITVQEVGESFLISVKLKLENQDIINYILNDYAEFSIELSCHSTMFRKCFSSNKPEFSFDVEKKLLNGKMDFECFVIVKKDILNYKNQGLNSDYEGHVINLHKGDVMVAYQKSSLPLNLDLRNVRHIKSFMKVQKNNRDNEHSVTYDLDSDKILILLPENMMTEYNKKPANISDNDERKVVLKASLFLQALTYALLHYKQYKDKVYAWVQALEFRMNEPDLNGFCLDFLNNDASDMDSQDIDDMFKLAHMMLNQPYLGMLKMIGADENSVGHIITED